MEAPERIHVPLDDVQNMDIPLKSLSGEPRSMEYTRSDIPHLPEEIVERVRAERDFWGGRWPGRCVVTI